MKRRDEDCANAGEDAWGAEGVGTPVRGTQRQLEYERGGGRGQAETEKQERGVAGRRKRTLAGGDWIKKKNPFRNQDVSYSGRGVGPQKDASKKTAKMGSLQ